MTLDEVESTSTHTFARALITHLLIYSLRGNFAIMKNIAVIGVGYVGLVTGTCFADLGNRVTCVDVNDERIANLNKASCLSMSRAWKSW